MLNNSFIKVDFKEFQKSKNSQLLYTEGVATCTAMTISYPGKFGYLLHITPTDGSYKSIGFLTRLLLKRQLYRFCRQCYEKYKQI